MKKINEIVIGMITILMLVGCGADNNGSLNSSDTETEVSPSATEVEDEIGADIPTTAVEDNPVSRFDINDYQAVEDSTSIEGIWVGISNYTEVVVLAGDDEGLVDSNRHSKRRIFSIVGDARQESQFYEDHLFYGLMSLFITGDKIVFEIADGLSFEGSLLTVTVTDNNKMTGTISSDKGDQDWVFVKVSNSVGSLGTVLTSTHWTNAQTSNEEFNAVVLFDEIFESTNNAGGSLYQHDYYMSFEESLEDADKFRRLLILKEDLLDINNNELSLRDIDASGSNVNITTSQSNSSSFIGTFSGFDDTDASLVVLTVNLSF